MPAISVVVPALFPEVSLVEGVERAAAAGADAVEFFDPEGADLDAVAEAADAHGVAVAATAAAGETPGIDTVTPSVSDPGSHDAAVSDLERSIEYADRVGAENLVVTIGQDRDDVDDHAQHVALVDVLRAVAPAAADAGVTVVPEPLNTRVDHPGYYLASSYEGYEIVHAVDHPNVRLLFDVYHQQITEGNVIQNLRNNVGYVGHMHLADVPGRHEPGTGEINYAAVLDALDDAGYDGYVGCEFSPTGDPDEAVRDVVDLAG